MYFSQKFLQIGTSESHPEQNDMIKLYNAMALFSLLGGITMLIYGLVFGIVNFYLYITLLLAIFYFSVILLNALGFYNIARLLVCIGSPVWVCGISLAIGGNFSQGAAIISSMAITVITYRNQAKIRNNILVFQILLYSLVTSYLSIYDPIYENIEVAFDELIVFWGSLGWAVILIYKYESDRSKILQDLKTNVAELSNTTEELEQFTYIASHDLKAPLSTINSFTDLIEKDLKTKNFDAVEKKLGFIKSGVNQMNYLVEDILELSLLKEQTKSIRSRLDLNEILNKAILNLSEEIKLSNAVINTDPLPAFTGNELELLLLFQNLIQNGIKYNRNKTPIINISSEITEENLLLKFTDNGIGIPEEYHQYIFQFFKRLHTREEFKGTGLGLGLCKKIVLSYDGFIHVDSKINEGSTFTVGLAIDN